MTLEIQQRDGLHVAEVHKGVAPVVKFKLNTKVAHLWRVALKAVRQTVSFVGNDRVTDYTHGVPRHVRCRYEVGDLGESHASNIASFA